MEYLTLALIVIIGCGDSVTSEKTIYEKVLLKKTAATLAKESLNPYLLNRYQQRPLNAIQYFYVYPEHASFQANPLELEKLRPTQHATYYNMPPQPHQGSLTRSQYVMQYNKLKSDLVHFLPAIMRTLTEHNAAPTEVSAQSQVLNIIPSTAATFKTKHVLKSTPKPLPLYITPSTSASSSNVSPSIHKGPTSSNFQNFVPIVPNYAFVPVPTFYKTPIGPKYQSTHLDVSNDRDYYRRPNYDGATQIRQPIDGQTASTQYHYELLDGDYVISNRRSTESKDFDDAGQSQFSDNERNKQGFQTSNGHNSNTEFNKGSKGSYDNSNYEGSFGQSNGDSSQNYEVSEANDGYGDQSSTSSGGEFNEKLAHRKGSHITGYHNVYHKDEYFKDHIFYDEADHSGRYRKFGKSFTGSENEESGRDEGDYKDGNHETDLKRQLDLYTKGYYEKDASGKQRSETPVYTENEGDQSNDRSHLS